MSLPEFYDRLSGSEIDERLALTIMDSPEYKSKVAKEKEEERVKNMTPEEQAALLMQIFNSGKK